MAVASPAGMRRGPRRKLALAAVAGLGLALSSGLPAAAAPKPSVKQLKKEISSLSKESDKLIEDYYNSRIALQKADKREKEARKRLDGAQEVLTRESTRLRSIAVQQYMNGGPNIANVFGGGTADGLEGMLPRLALTQHLVDQQYASLKGYAQVRDDFSRAQKEAAGREDELRDKVEDLEDRKSKAEKTIEKIRDRIDKLFEVPGARTDGTFVPQLPSGSDNITPRMRLVKTLIQERFDVPFGIGCYRSIQDGGEHPLGRACDFMLSRGGAMPSQQEIQRGNEICEWVVKNGKRLGIMYVIYRQRIWHVKNGSWRTMSDRGGTTANHYDHPHISVY
ncbi:hypothetical protein [Nonomuraea longicatena]|uniref:ARB-07466-like C-terminal domain-containing protein n=1 Tax=Nonomuraea longicatena TaxID=83682 RepID=A0ABN1R3B1_9ACTN